MQLCEFRLFALRTLPQTDLVVLRVELRVRRIDEGHVEEGLRAVRVSEVVVLRHRLTRRRGQLVRRAAARRRLNVG